MFGLARIIPTLNSNSATLALVVTDKKIFIIQSVSAAFTVPNAGILHVVRKVA
jgi:hypothetical protein